jgi:hypothetical protein
MSDLRAAAQQALEAWEHINLYGFVLADYEGPMEQAITALKAALEQQKPPPEAQTEAEKIAYCAGWWAAMEQKREQPEQEPVAWMVYTQDGKSVCVTDNPADFIEWRSFPLFTHPPRREWRSLSEEEIDAIQWHGSPFQFARAIEAALRSKNHE